MVAVVGSPALTVLPEEEWKARQEAYWRRIRVVTEPHRRRQEKGVKHPVHDFLFTYYSMRPGLLERWHPGAFVMLTGNGAHDFLHRPDYRDFGVGIGVDVEGLVRKRRNGIKFIAVLIQAIFDRPARFGCSGLHEWAMVYRTPEVRHKAWPLRMGTQEIAEFVESQALVCTHYDAFRFFTPAAVPLNRWKLTAEDRLRHEQAGCLHANMDLYKWCGKLGALCPGELLADAFELAVKAREIDMRASPYDLSSLGYEAIRIETPEGRAEYEREQRVISQAGESVRVRLLELCKKLLEFSE